MAPSREVHLRSKLPLQCVVAVGTIGLRCLPLQALDLESFGTRGRHGRHFLPCCRATTTFDSPIRMVTIVPIGTLHRIARAAHVFQATSCGSNPSRAEMRQRSERDRVAARLGHEHLRIAEAMGTSAVLERHYTLKELGAVWNLSTDTIARLFRDEPGVLKIGREQPRRGRRSYTTLRIPESVVQRVHRRLTIR